MRWGIDVFHPSNAKLRAWLATGEPEGVGEHVEQCDRCADRLEQLDADELDRDVVLGQALTAALSPPADLSERVMRGVAKRSRVDEELQLFAGLFSIGFETARLMIEPDVGQDHVNGVRSADEPTEEDDNT